MTRLQVYAFSTELGWAAIVGARRVLYQLTFGHGTPQRALAALDQTLTADAEIVNWHPSLVRRIERYAAGVKDEFRDVQIDSGNTTPFQQRVIEHCRNIPSGQTMTYGQLAAVVGSPGAARAVGNVMASNRTPLIVPCHRVVGSAGGLGGYSAAGGTRTKLRMLEMEAQKPKIRSTQSARKLATVR